MPTDLYKKLACHLDKLPGGFPPTEDGVELKILRKLFTPQEAELALTLTLIPETPAVIARRARLPKDEAARRLKEMSLKGLAFRIERPGQEPLYMAAQFVIGIWEYHVNDLDPELVEYMRRYIPTLFNPEAWSKAPQLRTIPVARSLPSEQPVLPYEQVEELVRAQKKILVAPCICRREHRLTGEGCDRPEETCLVFGIGADYYLKNGLGRLISLEETLEILEMADKAALVPQPSNAQKIVNICLCCGCCCQVLKTIKRYPQPARLVSSPFVAKAEPDKCKGCGICVERCQMEALSLEDDKVVLDRDRCIGCGLCVTTCPTGCLSLERKPDQEQKPVPRNMMEALLKTARARGKLGSAELGIMALKSKLDRLLASR